MHHFLSNSDHKAGLVERFKGTLRAGIWTSLTSFQTRHYIHILAKFVHAYKTTYPRTIDRATNQMRKKYDNELLVRLDVDADTEHRPQMSVQKNGQMVRISKVKGAFDRGYIPNFSDEHFLVQSDKYTPRRVFKLIDKGA